MNILLVNGSPKMEESASAYILNMLRKKLASASVCTWANIRQNGVLAEEIKSCDAVVLAFPLYVDGIPAHLLQKLEQSQDQLQLSGFKAKVYVIVNSGFFEARQNRIALDMMAEWCKACSLDWGQGLGLGCGPMADASPVGQGTAKDLGYALDSMAEAILKGESGENLYAQPNFPRRLYRRMAHMGWRLEARKNGLNQSELKKKASIVE